MPKYKKPSTSTAIFKSTASMVAFLVLVVGLVAGIVLIRSGAFNRTQAAVAPVTHEQTQNGGSTRSKSVSTTDAVSAQANSVYLASITTKPYREVTGMEGLGLSWKRVAAQCGGRETTGAELWMATGSPTSADQVTANFGTAPENTVITVSRFANADMAAPVSDVIGVNTNGISGECSNGKDSKNYSFDIQSKPNAITFGVVAERLRDHTPSSEFVELGDFHQGNANGDKAGTSLFSRYNTTGGTQKAAGTLSSEMDWAVIVVQVNGMQGGTTPPTTPTPAATPVGTIQPTSTPANTPQASNRPAPPTSPPSSPVLGIWTSPNELATKPMSGDAWTSVLAAANALPANAVPNLDNQDENTNVQVLAAAIVYARTGQTQYKDKVDAALKSIEGFTPKGRSLAWARETGAYAMAADLVGYRTANFEKKMRDMAETYICSERGTNMLTMFKERPNNWGTQAFGSLTAIYSYLGDKQKLQEVRSYFLQNVSGPKPAQTSYDDDLSWHCNEKTPTLINPAGCVKTCGGQLVNVDGIAPDDMRRGDVCSSDPVFTGYAWGTLEGIVMGARILERAGMPIWNESNSAICRAASALQDGRFGPEWKADGDDRWQLVLLDRACNKNWSKGTGPDGKPYGSAIWRAGKNTGWGYVVY